MLFFIIYIAAMAVLTLFMDGAEYLVCVMLLMLLCWVPGSCDTVTNRSKGMGIGGRYKYCKEYNNSNPLYLRKCLREKNKLSILGSIKGLYVCQMISLVVLVFSCIYLSMKQIMGRIIFVENILIASSFILIVSWSSARLYYKKCYDSGFRYMENKERIWQPFQFLYQPASGRQRKNSFYCYYNIGYEDLKKKLVQATYENKYKFSKCYREGETQEFNFFVRLKEDTLDIFALIHVKNMEEKCWERFNSIFEEFWKEKNIANECMEKQIAFTFLICVDEYSKELRKTKIDMENGVDSKSGRYRLSALLDYSDNSLLNISADCWQFGKDKRGEQIRNELLDMLDLSMDLDGKEYPEEGGEEELW